jgi:MoaA/NifB/PqqE/SkfB family radical SAM enzyme
MFISPLIKSIYTGYTRALGTEDFPATLDIELTNNCNLSCVMCSRQLMKRKIGYMDLALLNRIIEEARKYPIKSIGLHLFGEPLMHADLIKMIHAIKDKIKGTKVILSTNAYFLDKEKAKKLIASGLDVIRFSLDGTRQETYETIRQGSNFSTVCKNIKEFIFLRNSLKKPHPVIQLQILGMKDTYPQIKGFKKFWRPYLGKNDQIIVQEFMTFAGRVSDRTRLKFASFRDRIKRRLPCLRLWKNLVIYWDGKVSVCCYDYEGELLVGDLNREPIANVWKNGLINKMRQAQLEGRKSEFTLCNSCVRQEA